MQYIIVDTYIYAPIYLSTIVSYFTPHILPPMRTGGGEGNMTSLFHYHSIWIFLLTSPSHLFTSQISQFDTSSIFFQKNTVPYFFVFSSCPSSAAPRTRTSRTRRAPPGIHTSIHYRWLLVLWPHEVPAALPETCSRKPSGCNRAAPTRVFSFFFTNPVIYFVPRNFLILNLFHISPYFRSLFILWQFGSHILLEWLLVQQSFMSDLNFAGMHTL